MEYGAVEGIGVYNQMYSTKDYNDREDIHLPRTSSTTVNWNWINLFWGCYDGYTTEN